LLSVRAIFIWADSALSTLETFHVMGYISLLIYLLTYLLTYYDILSLAVVMLSAAV